MDAMWENGEVREAVLNYPGARELLERGVGRGMRFAGVDLEEYRGTVSGEQFIDDDECRLFPIGVPDLFLSRFAPAPTWQAVNTIGLPRYAQMLPPGEHGESRRILQVQSNPLHICTRPRTLFQLTSGT
jgi:hypothetical protein